MDPLRPSDLAAKQSPRWGSRLLAGIVVVGIFFRIVQWAWGQPFWTDEASLLLNVATKTARQLMGPLDNRQACPPLHLLLLRWFFVTAGDSEHSLRAVPLVLSLVTLPLFAVLVWRLLPPVEALLVLAIFAFSDRVLWHTAEAKQYTGDVFAVVVLLWIAAGIRRPTHTSLSFFIAAFAASGLIWLSYTTVFVFCAISVALGPAVFRERGGAFKWVGANLVFGISAVLIYFLSIRVQQTPSLVNLWQDQFVPWHQPQTIPIWFLRGFVALCDYPVKGLGGALLTLLLILGSIALIRQRRVQMLALMMVPFGLLLIASAFRQFPFNGNRVTFFTVPIILLTAGWGASMCYESFAGIAKYAGRALLGIMVIETFGLAVFHVWKPEPRTHILPAVEYLKKNYRPDEGIYVIGKGTGSMFMWYWRGEPANSVIYKLEPGDNVLLPWKRFWVLGIFQPKHGIAEMQKDVDYASTGAVEIQRYQGNGSAAILFAKP